MWNGVISHMLSDKTVCHFEKFKATINSQQQLCTSHFMTNMHLPVSGDPSPRAVVFVKLTALLKGCWFKNAAGSMLSALCIWLFQVCAVPPCVSWAFHFPISRASPSSWRSSQASSKSHAGHCPWLETDSSHLHLWHQSHDNHFLFYIKINFVAFFPFCAWISYGATILACFYNQLREKWKLLLQCTHLHFLNPASGETINLDVLHSTAGMCGMAGGKKAVTMTRNSKTSNSTRE